MKIVTVLGARPQFIKAGSVSREIQRQAYLGQDITEVIVHTGQHYDANMSDIFFSEMRIPKPKYFLGAGGSSHGAMTGKMLESIEGILVNEKPDFLMVYGDTNSTLAGALAAAKLKIKVVHVESGLRSFNMTMPEEINRILTDRVSSVLFCPTQTAVDNLNAEAVSLWSHKPEVIYSGDVMQDGAMFYSQLAEKPANIVFEDDFILTTIHRAENTDDLKRLTSIMQALNEIGETRQVILPIHPRTRKILEANSLASKNILVIDPVGYLNMVWLIKSSSLVITDSGGLQKEAFFFNKPCVTIRDETEWVELINIGVNKLAGVDCSDVVEAVKIQSSVCFDNTQFDLYGSGRASQRIVEFLLK